MTKRTGARKRATGVVRISARRDNETSTTTQEEAIQAYCDFQGLELVRVIVEKGRSGYKESRRTRVAPGEAIKDIKTGVSDTIVTWKIDRVARNARDLLNFIHDIEEAGGSFASVTDHFDTSTAMGRAMLTIVGALAELESATKGERIQTWQDYRRSSGMPTTGPAPFGYRRVAKRLVVDQSEAAIIRMAAAMLIEGASGRNVRAYMSGEASKLTDRKISHYGAYHILLNPVNAALRKGEEPGEYIQSDQWEPILDRETWDQVQAIFRDPTRRREKGATARKHLLGGMMACGREGCNGTLASKLGSRGEMRYSCRECDLSVRAQSVDAYIEEAVLGALDDQDMWRRLQTLGHRHVDTKAMEDELADLVRRRYLPQDDADRLTPAEWELMSRAIRQAMIDAESESLDLPQVDDPVGEWSTLPLDAKRLIINAVIARIEVGPSTPVRGRFDRNRIRLTPSTNIPAARLLPT